MRIQGPMKVIFFSPIGSAAAASQQPVVVGGPGDGLHRGHVVAVGLHKDGKLHKVIQSSSVKFTCMGVVCPPPAPDHTNSLLSLPPLARYWKNILVYN